MSESSTSASLLSVTTSVMVFTALLPPLADVRKSQGDPDMINDVRLGELASSALVVAIGVTASSLTKSPVPAMVAVVSAGALALMYESVLQAEPKKGATK